MRLGLESVTEVPPADRARDTQTDEIVALKKVRMDKEKDGEQGGGPGPRAVARGSRGRGPWVPSACQLQGCPRGGPRTLGFGSPEPRAALPCGGRLTCLRSHRPAPPPAFPTKSWPAASVCPTLPWLPAGTELCAQGRPAEPVVPRSCSLARGERRGLKVPVGTASALQRLQSEPGRS